MFETLTIFLAIGALGGLLATWVEDGHGPDLAGNVLAGAFGACGGGWLCNHCRLVAGGGLAGDLIGAAVGGATLLFLFRLAPRAAWLRAPAARAHRH
jgi:uncharacterized membrane protein YeaQ/YmgE (transglycosylase-associated protein family)